MERDRRQVADDRAMIVALQYEMAHRTPVHDIHYGDTYSTARIREVVGGDLVEGVRLSADIVSGTGSTGRVIEVKSRGGIGPIELLDRQKWTFEILGMRSWLYVVWNVTQPRDYELWTVHDPARLHWQMTRPNERDRGQFRGTRHEALWQVQSADIEAFGTQADLTGLSLPSKD